MIILNGKKFASILAITAMLAGFGMTGTIKGASRAELAAIHVDQAGNFQYWNNDSPAKKKLVAYVQKVTNPKNPDFIPVKHRLAVFDMDGTLLGERTPSYTDGVFYADRVLHDPNCKVSEEDKKFAKPIGMPFLNENQFLRKLKRIYIITYTPDWPA